jgi:hypothetical protein
MSVHARDQIESDHRCRPRQRRELSAVLRREHVVGQQVSCRRRPRSYPACGILAVAVTWMIWAVAPVAARAVTWSSGPEAPSTATHPAQRRGHPAWRRHRGRHSGCLRATAAHLESLRRTGTLPCVTGSATRQLARSRHGQGLTGRRPVCPRSRRENGPDINGLSLFRDESGLVSLP